MRNPSRPLLIMLLCAAMLAAAAPKKSIPLDVTGDGVSVLTVVKSLPCKVTAPEGATVYFWNVPDAVAASSDDNVLTVTKAAKGTYKISVVAIYIDFDKKSVRKDRGETNLVVGDVTPTPGPGPDPVPPPTPDVKGPLRVLIVFETGDMPNLKKTAPEQWAMIYDMKFRGALKDRADKAGPNGRGACIFDKDQDVTEMDKFWQDAMKKEHPKLPYLHIFKGDKSVFDGELPKTQKEALDLINKYAGE